MLALAACRTDPPKESTWDPGEDTDTDVYTDTDVDTDTDVEEGPIGVRVVTHWPEDRTFRAESHAHAVFSQDPEWATVVDPLGAMAWDGFDVFLAWAGWPLPGEGGRNDGFDAELGFEVRDLSTLDAGDQLLIVPLLESYRGELAGLTYYESDPEDEVTDNPFADGDLDLWIAGGADVAAAEHLGAVPAPDPVVLTSHDHLQMQVLGPDEPFTVAWEPSGDPDATIVVSLSGDLYSATFGVADDAGELEVSAEDLGAQGGDFLFVTVSRIVEREVQLPEGVLLVRGIQEVWTDVVQVEELGFSPARALTGRTSTIELYRADGVFDAEDLMLDLGEGVYPGEVEVIDDGHAARVRIDVDEDAEAEFRDVLVTTGGQTLLAPRQLGIYHELSGGDTCATEILQWTANEDREVFILFDEAFGFDDADLYAVIDVADAVDLYLAGDPLQGASVTLEVDNRSFDFIDGEPVFDFGEGVSVDAVRVPGGTGPVAEVDLSVAADAPLGDRTVTVTQGAASGTSRLGDFQVSGALDASDDCTTAAAVPTLETARFFGTTDGLTDLGIDTAACGPSTMPGTDAVYRFTLPSAGDSISASLTTGDFDGAVYVVDSCTGRPVVCADLVADNDTELLTWAAGAGEAGDHFLMIDSRDADGAGTFTLDVNVP